MTARSGVVPAGPHSTDERIPWIDVLRGFAMFGVLLVNLFEDRVDTHSDGSAIQHVVWFLADAKFYPMLSFLFGMGFALQLTRLTDRGAPAALICARRSAALIGIGIVAYAVLMANTVLVQYGILGFGLLLFRKASSRLVLAGALAFALLSVLYSPVSAYVRQPMTPPPRPAATALVPRPTRSPNPVAVTLKSGSFGAIASMRASSIINQLLNQRFWLNDLLFQRFALFLLGLYIARRAIHSWPALEGRLLRTTVRFGIAAGLLGNVVLLLPGIARPAGAGFPLLLALVVRRMCNALANPALGFGYAACLLLLIERSRSWRARAAALGPVGRTALSNFLLQYAVIMAMFWLQRWGLIGDTGPAVALLLSILVFAFEVWLSRWWLERFRFGPAEWLWRAATYWTVPPMQARRRISGNEA